MLAPLLSPLSSSVHRRDPAGCRGVGEGEPGGLFLSGVWGEHQCTICPHRDRSHHRYFRTLRMLRYVPRQPVDAQTGRWSVQQVSLKCSSHTWPCVIVCLCMLSAVRHVFDLGVPGWACCRCFRLYLQTWGEFLTPPPEKIQIYLKNEPHQLIKIYNLLCF